MIMMLWYPGLAQST